MDKQKTIPKKLKVHKHQAMQKQQYEIISNRYDKRLSSIQTVIAFYTVFITTLLLILCDGLKISELLYFHDVILNFHSYKGKIIISFIISILGIVDTVFTILSVISQRKSCEKLKNTLLTYEKDNNLDTIHNKDNIKIPILFTIISFCFSLLLFFLVFIYILLLLLSQLY